MMTHAERPKISSFACKFGDRERVPESIEDFKEICSSKGLHLGLSSMGCGTFWQMTQSIESYIIQCVSETLSSSGVLPKDVSHIVLTTVDSNLCHLYEGFVRNIQEPLGLINCVPTLLSMQQCVGSLAALNFAYTLFTDVTVDHVVMVAFDFVINDSDRIRPFALFGDAVTSCILSRDNVASPSLSLLSYGANIDFAGVLGHDDFQSRKNVTDVTLKRALTQSDTCIEDIESCFTSNLFKPIALFNASLHGINRSQLYIGTLKSHAHCGNCDWMMNLTHYQQHIGIMSGKKYLAQSYAPGFYACGLLEASIDEL